MHSADARFPSVHRTSVEWSTKEQEQIHHQHLLTGVVEADLWTTAFCLSVHRVECGRGHLDRKLGGHCIAGRGVGSQAGVRVAGCVFSAHMNGVLLRVAGCVFLAHMNGVLVRVAS